MKAEVHYSRNTTIAPKVRKVTNQLYNVKVEFDILDCPTFRTTAIIDTGASVCYINKKVIPEEALEPLTRANLLKSMKGGIRIKGDEITIYKKVTRIKASNQTEIAEITELEVGEEEFLEINESLYFNQEGSKSFLEQFKPVIERLKHQGYIKEEPLKHWKKNGKLYKLDIINPDIIIENQPLKHVTPAMEDSFKKHVDSLLEIGAIRPSKSRHKTMAMIINSGTTIDPTTGREIKRKEKMRIGGAKIFSKFDLKSWFHQVAMDEESIPWTTFLVPRGLYEWLVMPFDHAKHLERMLKICEDNGLVLSLIKIKIAVSTVDFLGAVIGEGTIKLQPHIIKKIVNFNEEELKKKKGLRTQRRNEEISSSSSLLSGGSLTFPYAFQKNMKITYEQKKQSNPCEAYMQSYNARPKSDLENPLKITTGLTKEKMLEFKTKKPEESSLNWKPLHNDWVATSNPNEVQAYNSIDNKCRYNRKGFLKDDNSSDDSIFIVDPGWDDYCL
nr:TPA: orf y [Tanacetum cinerariifolium]